MDRFYRATGAVLNAADAATKSLSELQVVQKSKGAYQEWNAVDPFPYEALPTPTSIRLLKIEPSKAMQKAAKAGKPLSGDAHDDDDDIRFVMQTAEMDRNPRFTALSYTWRRQRSALTTWSKWGYHALVMLLKDKAVDYELPDPDEELRASRKATCNGHTIKVFDNLFEAFKQLRRDRPGEWLWIDAVCMNQNDPVELVAQIQIMDRIYRSAQLVVVWLGPFPSVAEKGLKTLEKLAHSGEPLPDNPLYATKVGVGAAEDWRLESAALTAFHLAYRSYFKRVWVVQELCLAREAIYLHGKHEISLETLLASCKWCIDSGSGRESADWAAMQSFLAPYYVAHMRFLPTTLDARKEFAKGNKWTLLQWFRACNGRLASVAKDYIFGGLSLVKEDCLVIDQHLQTSEAFAPPLPRRRPVGGREPNDATTTADPTSKFSAPAPSVDQSLTPKGLWPKLAPNYSASDAEVFVNAAACLLSHASLEDLLRIAGRLRDRHQFRTSEALRPHELEAFSGLPSWVPAIGSWMSRLTMDLAPPGANSPYTASSLPSPDHGSGTAQMPPVTSNVSISADGRTLSVSAAMIDRVASYAFEKDRALEFTHFRKLLKFLDQPSSVYSTSQDLSTQQLPAHGGQEDEVKEARPCLLEAVARAMVAGHVNGRQVTPSEAGTWLCENIVSKAQQLTAETRRRVSDDQQTRQALEAKALKRGQSTEYLEKSEDDRTAQKWRVYGETISQDLEVVAEVAAGLEALKVRYPHLQWLPTDTVAVVPKEEDAERAKLERRNSKEKELEELLERRSINAKSGSSIRDALDRGLMRTTEMADSMYDRLNMWSVGGEGRYRRLVSDGCHAFEEACVETLTWRRVCLTGKGHVLLGPLWLEEGDTVMLLPGVSVPFVFAPQKEDLEREEARIKERLTHVDTGDDEDIIWSAAKPHLNTRLVEVQDRLQRVAEQTPGERWVLVGEAYIEGIMMGEAAQGLEYAIINIV